jgi:hypothetical protein
MKRDSWLVVVYTTDRYVEVELCVDFEVSVEMIIRVSLQGSDSV